MAPKAKNSSTRKQDGEMTVRNEENTSNGNREDDDFHPSPLHTERHHTTRKSRGGRGTRGGSVAVRPSAPRPENDADRTQPPVRQSSRKRRSNDEEDTNPSKRTKSTDAESDREPLSNTSSSPNGTRRPPRIQGTNDGTPGRSSSAVKRRGDSDLLGGKESRIMNVIGDQALRIERLESCVEKNTIVVEKLQEKIEGMIEKVESLCGVRREEKKIKTEKTMRNDSIEKYKMVMMEDLVMLPALFSKECFCWSVSKSMFKQVLSKYVARKEFNVETLRDFVAIMFFCLKPYESRTKMLSAAAKEGIRFRRAVVLACMDSAQENFLSLYTDYPRKVSLPPRPFWLATKQEDSSDKSSDSYVVPQKSLNKGIDSIMCGWASASDSDRRNSIASSRVEPNYSDYGEFIGRYGYTQLTNLFNIQRRSVAHSFGESIGYIFTDWGEEWEKKGVSKKSLKVCWNFVGSGREIKLKDIPKAAEVCRIAESNGRSAKKYKSAVNDYDNVQVIIEHDVVITGSRHRRKSKSEDDGGRPKTRLLRRVISLMDVAINIVYAMSGHKASTDANNILDLHPQSIIAIYLLALGLRDFITHQDMVEIERGVGDETPPRTPDEEKQKYSAEIWSYLKPNLQIRDRFLKRVLQVTEDDYRSRHAMQPGEESSDEQDEDDSGGRAAAARSGTDDMFPDVFVVDDDDNGESCDRLESGTNTGLRTEDDEDEEGEEYEERIDTDNEQAAAEERRSQGGSRTASQSLEPFAIRK